MFEAYMRQYRLKKNVEDAEFIRYNFAIGTSIQNRN